MPDDRRAQVEPGDLVGRASCALLAELDLAELELAQLGDRLLARLGGQPHPLDLDLGDLAAVLGDRGLDLARRCPAAAPARAAASARRVSCGQALVEQRLLAGDLAARAGRSASLVARLQRLEALVLLGDLGLLLVELRLLLGLQLAAGRRTAAAARAISVGDLRVVAARATSSGSKVIASSPSRSASSRLLRASDLEPLALDGVELAGRGPRPRARPAPRPPRPRRRRGRGSPRSTPPVGCWITWRLPCDLEGAGADDRAGDLASTAPQAPRPKTSRKSVG